MTSVTNLFGFNWCKKTPACRERIPHAGNFDQSEVGRLIPANGKPPFESRGSLAHGTATRQLESAHPPPILCLTRKKIAPRKNRVWVASVFQNSSEAKLNEKKFLWLKIENVLPNDDPGKLYFHSDLKIIFSVYISLARRRCHSKKTSLPIFIQFFHKLKQPTWFSPSCR